MQVVDILDDWVRRDAPRLDADVDGLYDEPGPAIMDAVWEPVAEAVMRPRFGDLVEALDDVRNLNDLSGESYVDKDLRSLLGKKVEGPFNLSYCGKGKLAACRASLWEAIHASADAARRGVGARPVAVAHRSGHHRLRAGPPAEPVPDHQPPDLPAGPRVPALAAMIWPGDRPSELASSADEA